MNKIAITSFAVLAAGIMCSTAGACCFVRGTKILTPRGPRCVEEIAVGDEVYAFDTENNQLIERPVSHVLRALSTEIFHIAAGELVISGVTGEHPFYDADRKDWTEARNLTVGTRLLAWHGNENPLEIEVTTVRRTTMNDRIEVFNLTVNGPEHNYFAEGLLVHNKSPARSCTEVNADGVRCCHDGDSGSEWCYDAIELQKKCFDGLDNDLDGWIDEQDPDCKPSPEDCFDGLDNDFDGRLDEQDPDCAPGWTPGSGGKATWNQRFGDASKQRGNAIASSEQHVAVVGEYEGSVDLGFGVIPSAGDTDAFVVKLSSLGQPVWAKGFGGNMADRANAVSFGFDAVYVTGEFRGTVDFGLGPVTSVGGADAFLVKYDFGGSLEWVRTFGGPGDDTGTSIVSNGITVFVAGEFQDTAGFGLDTLTSTGGRDIFLLAMDATGNPAWQKQFGTPLDDTKPHIAQRDSTWLALSATLGSNLFLTSLNLSDQTVAFAKTFPAGGGEISVAHTAQGSLVVAGHFLGSLDFGGWTLFANGPGSDAFVANFAANGEHVWSKRIAGAGEQRIHGLEIDGSGLNFANEFYVTGTNDGILDFGGATLDAKGTPSGFVAKFQPDGTHTWSQLFSSSGRIDNRGLGITVDRNDHSPVFTGSIDGEIDLGLGPIFGENSDILVAKLRP